jgi:hypothetical protein
MRFRLRTLLIVLAVGPAVLAGGYFVVRSLEVSAPLWAIAGSTMLIAFWLVMLILVVRRAISRDVSRSS